MFATATYANKHVIRTTIEVSAARLKIWPSLKELIKVRHNKFRARARAKRGCHLLWGRGGGGRQVLKVGPGDNEIRIVESTNQSLK